MGRRGQRAQNLRELARGELARSTGAVAEPGEATHGRSVGHPAEPTSRLHRRPQTPARPPITSHTTWITVHAAKRLRAVTISPPQKSPQTHGSSAPSGTGAFDVVRRGYDRDQVDSRLRELQERLAAAESARQAAEQHALATEDELRAARSKSQGDSASTPESFGFRAEKILRLAEHEAADVRSRAASEASSVIEQARADAERHRHEVEQSLIARAAELDQEAAKRGVALQEREQQAAATLAAAREEGARISDDAQRAADALVNDAKARAEELRHRTEQENRRRREAAEQELRRVNSLNEGVRGEMARLHKLLAGELDSERSAGGERRAPQPAGGDDKPTG
jgi:hypothetical protein